MFLLSLPLFGSVKQYDENTSKLLNLGIQFYIYYSFPKVSIIYAHILCIVKYAVVVTSP